MLGTVLIVGGVIAAGMGSGTLANWSDTVLGESPQFDGAAPRLPLTIRVSGHVVRPTSSTWRTRASGGEVLLATLPARWSEHRTLKVRVVVHGTGVRIGQTSAAAELVRAR